MNKIILIECQSLKTLVKAWEFWGYKVYEAEVKLSEESAETIKKVICEKYLDLGISYIFSFDFFPEIAIACKQAGLTYISWVIDCPHIMLWSETSKYECNKIFVFDYVQFELLLARGMKNVYYLPLCTDIELFDECISNNCSDLSKYYCDVSFVGNLYNDEAHSLYDKINFLPDYVRGYLDSLMLVQRKMWGVDLLTDAISGNINKLLREYVKIGQSDNYVDNVFEIMFMTILTQKIAQIERKEVCSYLARNFDFCLYTGSDTSYDPLINNCGYADYLKTMPLVFRYSKVNIHITLRSITSGVPLRVVDVLACGGFLLTNYQPEIAEYFVDGEELVIYHSFEDMYEKIRYYLQHDEERERIACAGYKKVKEQFNYINGTEEIVKVLEDRNEKSTSGLFGGREGAIF